MKLEKVGAWIEGAQTSFRVWAPKAERAEVVLWDSANHKSYLKMEKADRGYFSAKTQKAPAGSRYQFRLNEYIELPDPASRYQPEGPHGPSQVVESAFSWQDQNWKGLSLREMVIYELHVGTFSEEGTFEALEKKIPHLKELGFNAIEIMPIAQFAGKRNWGYDGVGLYAAQNNYGGREIAPIALKRLINACHLAGIAVLLDVVYNHLGPEGNYLPQWGEYFQSKYKTPWGDALNYDGADSDEVRNYFLGNAQQWLEEFHFDGLRLDAVHAILDTSAQPFLAQLSDLAHGLQEKLQRQIVLIAESDANDSRILKPTREGGQGLDGQWADDLHHIVHTLLTHEKHGYYGEYGTLEQLAHVYRHGLLFQGEYSPCRRRSHGRSYKGVDHFRLVVCSQNHDQIGNRRDGERLISLVGPQKQKLAAACVLLSGALPLIFMGEEIAETAPFQYFVDHTDQDLLEAVRKGRKEEFASSAWEGEAPDPASVETFLRSKIDWKKAETDPLAQEFKAYYKKLIELSKWIRREDLLHPDNIQVDVLPESSVMFVRGRKETQQVQILFSWSERVQTMKADSSARGLDLVLDSSENTTLKKHQGFTNDFFEIQPFSVIVLRSR